MFPNNRDSSSVLHRYSALSVLLCAASDEGQGQFSPLHGPRANSCLLQVARSEGMREGTFSHPCYYIADSERVSPPALVPSRPTHVCACEMGQFYCTALAKFRD